VYLRQNLFFQVRFNVTSASSASKTGDFFCNLAISQVKLFIGLKTENMITVEKARKFMWFCVGIALSLSILSGLRYWLSGE
jgi:hypothetical protein